MKREKQKIFLGSDHAGFQLKKRLFEEIGKEFPEIECIDLGCHSEESVDYPQFAKAVADRVARSEGMGILVCGSGIGQAIAANKVKGVRAASIWNTTAARLSRAHNDLNVLCLGSRLLGPEVALDICRVWLKTSFEGGRHQARLDLIQKMEKSVE